MATHPQRGQASVELVAVLPVLAAVALCAWQVVVAGSAAGQLAAAARAAARARAVGTDPERAARAVLPRRLRSGLVVRLRDAGAVEVAAGVPAVVGGGRLLTLRAAAQFADQGAP